MMDQIKKYFSEIYFEEIGMKIVPVIFSAFLLRGLMKRFTDIDEKKYRLRMNLLLYWERGWFKTQTIKHIKRLTEHELVINTITQSTASALRGSFNEGKFVPPEFLISDVICALELAPFLGADMDNIGVLLNALDEGDIRVALIKFPDTIEARESVAQYDAKLENRRLSYHNRAIEIVATHALEVIPLVHREAYLNRHFILHIPSERIDRSKIFDNYLAKMDLEFEERVKIWFSDILRNAQRPNFEELYSWVKNYFPQSKITNPREASDIIRLLLADRIMYQKSTPSERIKRVLVLISESGNYFPTPRELIAEAICDNPMSLSELEILTGTSKANILGHLNRLKAEKIIRTKIDERKREHRSVNYVIRGETNG